MLSQSAAALSGFPAVHLPASTSNAPLTITVSFPSIRLTVVMSFRSESNGSVAARGYFVFNSSLVMPFFIAANTIAVSVGSPICLTSPFSSVTLPSEQRVPNIRSRFTLSLHDDVIFSSASPEAAAETRVILFCVRVPVLSEQITDAEPSVSTAGRLRIIALRFTIR